MGFNQEKFKGYGTYSTINKKMMKSEIGLLLYQHPRSYAMFNFFNNQYECKFDKKNKKLVSSNKDNLCYTEKQYKSHGITKRIFDKNIDNLIEWGLIKIIKYRFETRECTIYGMSEMWLNWGTKDFKIEECDKRIQKRAYQTITT